MRKSSLALDCRYRALPTTYTQFRYLCVAGAPLLYLDLSDSISYLKIMIVTVMEVPVDAWTKHCRQLPFCQLWGSTQDGPDPGSKGPELISPRDGVLIPTYGARRQCWRGESCDYVC
jgi:hypothetical protein